MHLAFPVQNGVLVPKFDSSDRPAVWTLDLSLFCLVGTAGFDPSDTLFKKQKLSWRRFISFHHTAFCLLRLACSVLYSKRARFSEVFASFLQAFVDIQLAVNTILYLAPVVDRQVLRYPICIGNSAAFFLVGITLDKSWEIIFHTTRSVRYFFFSPLLSNSRGAPHPFPHLYSGEADR